MQKMHSKYLNHVEMIKMNIYNSRASIYSISVIFKFLINLLIVLPFFTKVIDIKVFGVHAMSYAVIALLQFFSTSGIEWNAFKNNNPRLMCSIDFIYNALWLLIIRIIFLITFLAICSFWSALRLNVSNFIVPISIIVLSQFVSIIWEVIRPYKIQEGKLYFVAFFGSIPWVISSTLVILLLTLKKVNPVDALFLVVLIESILQSFVLFFQRIKFKWTKFNYKKIIKLFRTTLKVTIVLSGPSIGNFIERYYLLQIIGLEKLAIYTHGVAYRSALQQGLSGIVNSLISVLRSASENDNDLNFPLYKNIFLFLFIASAAAYDVGIILINYASSGLFNNAAILLPIWCIASMFTMVSHQITIQIKVMDLKLIYGSLNWIKTILFLTLLIILVKNYGFIGAGYTYLICEAITFILLYIIARFYYIKVYYLYKMLIFVLLASMLQIILQLI
jgi:O-antigen/teichoic acid export membrane protein